MASIGSEHAPRSYWRMPTRLSWRADLSDTISRLRALFADGSDSSLARRLAGAAFLIRVVSALLAFISQILLARWMGGFDFGIYIYAWTWVLLIGGMVDLGLGSASQRLIPEYTEHGQFALLRGYLRGSRFLATAIACAIALAGAAAVTLLRPYLGPETTVPLYLSCAALPMFGLGQVLSGIARSYDWVNLGLAPTYVLRQIALLALMGLAFALGLPTDATTATLLGVAALWSVTIGQLVVLDRRLARTVAKGPQAYAVRSWLAVSAPIFVVEAFYLLLTYSDVIVLKQFRPPDEVAIYYAAAKTLALVAFIYFSVAQTIAHKFAGYHVSGDRKGLSRFSQAFDPADILAVACFDPHPPRGWQADAAAVRQRFRLRLLSDVHHRRRAPGARRRRPGGAAAQHSWRAALMRARLRRLLLHRSRAVPRAHPLAGDRRRRNRQRRGAHLRVGEPVLRRQIPAGFALPDFWAVGALRPGHGGQSVSRSGAGCRAR